MGEPCAICGRPIDYSLDWWTDPSDGKRKRHPLSFEYDHRVPFASSGDNSFSNAQAVHRICNQRKGDGTHKHSSMRGDMSCANGTQVRDEPKQMPTSRAW